MGIWQRMFYITLSNSTTFTLYESMRVASYPGPHLNVVLLSELIVV